MELMQCSNQWATRPDDERFVSLTDMQQEMWRIRNMSREKVLPNRKIELEPVGQELCMVGKDALAKCSHWSFGQLATLAKAPAGYLRTLPPEMAADCVNYGMRFNRDVEDVQILVNHDDEANWHLRAATGPRYGRIWNQEIVDTLVTRFGDGVTGQWKVPGEFGKHVPVTKDNTTLYASDRDMFVFLCDEENRIEVANRRGGQRGSLARGFFVWNSEVGSKTFGIAMFLFDFVCANRIVWGATEYKEVKMKHTSGAPERFADGILPMLRAYANNSSNVEEEVIREAQKKRVDDVEAFLNKRFSKRATERIKASHMLEEQRPMETLWDITTGITAYAKNITHQDERVEVERIGGKVLEEAK